jgi:hypothetical protein
MPLSLPERIHAASTTLIVARASFDIWRLYAGASTRPTFFAGMEEYSEFFWFDEEAHFRVAVVGIYSLFDGRTDTVTLTSLIDAVKALGNDVASIRSRLELLAHAVKAVKTLRHKLFAHRDHGLGYNEAYQLAKVRPDDLRTLLDESLAILNDLACLLSLPKFAFNEFVAQHTSEMLHKLQPG